MSVTNGDAVLRNHKRYKGHKAKCTDSLVSIVVNVAERPAFVHTL
jgi:hypothetical protein